MVGRLWARLIWLTVTRLPYVLAEVWLWTSMNIAPTSLTFMVYGNGQILELPLEPHTFFATSKEHQYTVNNIIDVVNLSWWFASKESIQVYFLSSTRCYTFLHFIYLFDFFIWFFLMLIRSSFSFALMFKYPVYRKLFYVNVCGESYLYFITRAEYVNNQQSIGFIWTKIMITLIGNLIVISFCKLLCHWVYIFVDSWKANIAQLSETKEWTAHQRDNRYRKVSQMHKYLCISDKLNYSCTKKFKRLAFY